MIPVVTIVGRPNVGKSTLFNAFLGRRKAVVDDIAGVTRDVNYALVKYQEYRFWLADTGGYTTDSSFPLSEQIREQVNLAIAEADAILFLLDAKTGLTPEDEFISRLLRRTKKHVIYVINKVDSPTDELNAADFARLGVERFITASAIHKKGLIDIAKEVEKILPNIRVNEQKTAEIKEEGLPKVAVVGRPNVGKSSIINRIIGKNRLITDETPGTTRDAIEVVVKLGNKEFILIDTAGIRRRAKIKERVEAFGIMRSLSALEMSEIALLVLDVQDGITSQDQKIASKIIEAGKAMIVLANKWDLVKEPKKAQPKFEALFREQLRFAAWAPLIFVSATKGFGLTALGPIIERVRSSYYKRVSTSKLNRFVKEVVSRHPAPEVKGKRLKIFYATQTQVAPPTIVLFVNDPDLLHFSYERFITNHLRELDDFTGTPIRVIFQDKSDNKRQKVIMR